MPRKEAPAEEPLPISEETDESLVDAANRVFGDDMVPNEPPDLFPDIAPSAPTRGPGIGKMVTVRGGGLYLPARQRVVWMRGEPVAHPNWTIDTIAEEINRGTFKLGKVEGGYARYRANVFDETGRLIATGTKTEYSERFTDFAEKAETGSIGRALAVAGYGTEAAIDLDEGVDDDRIADAPVDPVGRPINITASSIPDVRPGGRPITIQMTQMAEIGNLNRQLGLGLGLISLMEGIKGEKMPPLEEGKEQEVMRTFLETFTYEEAGQLVQQLRKALDEDAATTT